MSRLTSVSVYQLTAIPAYTSITIKVLETGTDIYILLYIK